MKTNIVKLGIIGIIGFLGHKIYSKNKRKIKIKLSKYIDSEKLVNSYIQTKLLTYKDFVLVKQKSLTSKIKDLFNMNK